MSRVRSFIEEGIIQFMKNNAWFKCVLLGVAIIGLAACSAKTEDNKKKEEKDDVAKDERVPVEVEKLGRGFIEAVVLSSANLEAEQEVKVYSRTTNQVKKLLVEEGMKVKAGQLLVQLEDGTHKLQLAKAEARLAKAKREFERAQDLFRKEFLAQEDLNNATYELKQAELQYAEADNELSYTRITAPIGGTITARKVNLGDFVNANQHLFDIVDYNSIVARVYLPEKGLGSLAIGQEARLSSKALGEEKFKGKIKRIAPLVDAKTGTVKVTVAVNTNQKLMPGMYVDVAIVLETKSDALLIPKRALVYDNDLVYAFRVNRGGERIQVDRVAVVPSLADENAVMPLSGFNDGDEIVVAGQTGLKDKAFVRLLGEPDPEAKKTPETKTAQKESVAQVEVAQQ